MNPFKVDFIDSTVLRWYPGGRIDKDRDYTPSFYISAEGEKELEDIQEDLEKKGYTVETGYERWKTSWRDEEERVLKLGVEKVEKIKPAARRIRTETEPGKYRLFNVDLSPRYRYFLEKDLQPEHRKLSSMEIKLPRKDMARERVTEMELDGRRVEGSERDKLQELGDRLEEKDPDILVLNSSRTVPVLEKRSEELEAELNLGRMPGYRQLAGESEFTSYGIKKHSPARYSVPGRAIIDRSNSFFLSETGIHGILDLVERSWKPVQEASWASIGNILTAIQIRHALKKNVLVPWKSWRAEMPKKMSTLHRSDRGGFIFSPETGVHKNVAECDFSSLYPNIICQKNVSPDVIRCSCHDRDDVPGLGYSVCDRDGYLKEVLQPLIDDRDRIKQQIRRTEDSREKKKLEQKSDAIKWILVSCFGYQGFNNAKFGRIECHESINAYAREILLNAKEEFEKSGWKVVHGIIDSIWVKKREKKDGSEDVREVCERITGKENIRLEYEGEYDWICFCPRRESKGGALNRYFGKKKNGEYKFRGIELRQSSTPEYIKECQRAMIERFDSTKDPEKVLQLARRQISDINNHRVAPEKLAVEKRVTKRPEDYSQNLKNKLAVERAREKFSVDYRKGESVSYIVVNDEGRGMDRIGLPELEEVDRYDPDFYRKMVLRACESVVSGMGWTRPEIESYLSGTVDPGIDAYT